MQSVLQIRSERFQEFMAADRPEPAERKSAEELDGDRQLDITADTCPMTFVRTRLALDRMLPGETLLLRLRGEEPRRNIPRTATEQGHSVIAQQDQQDGSILLLIRKGP